MSKGLKVALIIALVLVIVGMICMGAARLRGTRMRDLNNVDLSFGLEDLGISLGSEGFDSDWTESGSYRVPVEGIRSVEIDWVAGNVTVRPSDGTEITFTEYCRVPLTEQNSLRYRVKDGTLTIQFCKSQRIGINNSNLQEKELEVLLPASLAAGLDTFSYNGVSADLTAEELTAAKLSGNAVSGAVTFRSCAATEVDCGTVSGGIQLADCAADRVEAEAVSGAIDLAGDLGNCNLGTTSGSITLDTSRTEIKVETSSVSGRQRLSGAFAELEADSTSGDVTVTCTGTLRELDVDTTSGDVSINLPADCGFTLDYDTSSGTFQSDLAMMTQGSRRVYGDGVAEIEVETTSGDLTVRAN